MTNKEETTINEEETLKYHNFLDGIGFAEYTPSHFEGLLTLTSNKPLHLTESQYKKCKEFHSDFEKEGMALYHVYLSYDEKEQEEFKTLAKKSLKRRTDHEAAKRLQWKAKENNRQGTEEEN